MKKYVFSDSEIEEIIRLYNDEMLGTPTIGKKFNVDKGVINRILKKNNITMGPSGGKFKGGKSASDKRYREKEENKLKQQIYMETYGKEYRENNRETLNNKAKVYRNDNVDEEKLRHKIYYDNNKEKIKIYREGYKTRRTELHREKMLNDSMYKLKHNIRSLISYTFRNEGYSKTSKTQDILGCSFEEFKTHIESQWEDWMTWDNYGNPKDGIYELNKTWDLDHMVCISSAITEQEVIDLNHYTNLQPLCSYTNRFIKQGLID